ncbi:hypothetical protein GO003_024075 [Methylicorpusculum oleiharenae]|uniref:hypothetical protein n=1 Tax=Methylicorpusculum oleiharenae TaxID=1338687 RepID=UPI001358234D|nr:hypothetical protein [Methylicorpusculum oleiharenae]MCD2453462.1 hypothetical protein [Methylicorpusculum oleiharenae]
MKNIVIIFCFFLSFNAYAIEKKTEYKDKDKDNKVTAILEYDCIDDPEPGYHLPWFECVKQTLVFPELGSLKYQSNDIEYDENGTFKYWISSVGYIKDSDNNMYYVLYYCDKSGGGKMTEERWEILEKNDKGELVSKFGLMSYVNYKKIMAILEPITEVTFDGGLNSFRYSQ